MSDQNLWDGSQSPSGDFDASDIISTQQTMSAAAYALGTSFVLTIKQGIPRSFNGEPYVVLEYAEVPEVTRLANMNLRRLVRLHGTGAAGWRGKQIRLTVTEITEGELSGKHMFVLDGVNRELGDTLKYEMSEEMRALLASQNQDATPPAGKSTPTSKGKSK